MAEIPPQHKRTGWASAWKRIAAVLAWKPVLSPETYKLVKRGAVCAFAVDVGILVAVHYGWLDQRWSTVREWENVGAMFLMSLWITEATERRRKVRPKHPQV